MEINFPPIAENGTKYLDRIVLSADSGIVSWKENMSDIERRNLCSALIYPVEGVAVHANQSSDSSGEMV